MKKLTAVMATFLVLTGCGSALDLSVTPNSVANDKGVEAAKQWCVERKDQVTAAEVLSSVVHVPFSIAYAPFAPFVGPFYNATKEIRDAQCAEILKQ